MIVLFGALALVVGAVAALALNNWWILIVVMALHLLASAVVLGYAWLRVSESYDKPDPVTEARIEETTSKEEQDEIRRDAREDVLDTSQR
jgi:membrane protein implicated in regulation of membrane protease activity